DTSPGLLPAGLPVAPVLLALTGQRWGRLAAPVDLDKPLIFVLAQADHEVSVRLEDRPPVRTGERAPAAWFAGELSQFEGAGPVGFDQAHVQLGHGEAVGLERQADVPGAWPSTRGLGNEPKSCG